MTRPIAVVVGFVGKIPVAGMGLYNLHYMMGLQDLGYDLHYVEHLDGSNECYDPENDTMTSDPTFAVSYLTSFFGEFGLSPDNWSLVDHQNRCHGSGWAALRAALDRADFVLDLADATWFDELGRCARRAFVDGDPMFTQVAILDEGSDKARALEHYDTFFTIGSRLGAADCTIPSAGKSWIATRSVVCTRLWITQPARRDLPVTTLMNWASSGDVSFEGRTYGLKGVEFERFLDLPARCQRRLSVAVGGPAPRKRILEHGWDLVDPLAATRTTAAYRDFIAGSFADLGIAKHAYVASRSGWFSDRSLCYLASGRPVLHQDTGFTDWLPSSDGVLPFATVDDVIEHLELLEADYEKHAIAARLVAEEQFEASTVVGRMLDDGGLR